MLNKNPRERDVERRMGRVESPEPPADLLDRIRGDIPEYLRPADRAAGSAPAGRRPYRLLAASLLLAVTGGFLAYRVLQQAPPSSAPPATVQQRAAAPAPPPVTIDAESSSAAAEDSLEEKLATLPILPPPPAGVPAQQENPAQENPTQKNPAPGVRRVEPTPERRDTAPPAEPEPGALSAAPSELRAAAGVASDGPLTKAVPLLPEDRLRLQAQGHLGDAGRDPEGAAATTAAETVAPRTAPVERWRRGELPKPRQRRLDSYAPPQEPAPIGSTGGTAEPNDQPWGDMFFRPYGTNPFVDTEDDALSTFGLDVDTGSYTLARSYLERGHLPPPEAIRVEEFVNFFDYDDPAPRRGDFTLTAEAAPSPWMRGPRYQLLRIGVQGREVSARQRRDATLIFVVDTSGSMAREDRIQLVKGALFLLLDQLGDGDRVGLVIYGSRGQVLLEPTADLEAVRRAVSRLSTGGSTNVEEGLALAYDLARRHYRPGAIHRLVLCSDGVANVGRTGPESILARVGREAGEGIELTTVGFGMGNYNDVLMEQLADRGDGNYSYVDTLDEARRVFVANLTGTLETIASDAKIQVEFDPRVVTRYRLLGYENRNVADHRFRDDTVDAGEIGAGHSVSALYELKLADDAPRRRALAEVRLRYRSKATGQVVEDSLAVGQSELERSWSAASPSLRLAALAAELAEVLKRSYWTRETPPEELRARALAVGRNFAGERNVAELVRLAERTADLAPLPSAPPE